MALNFISVIIIILIIFSIFIGIFTGLFIAKRRTKKEDKKLEIEALNFLDGKKENKCIIEGKKYNVKKFITPKK